MKHVVSTDHGHGVPLSSEAILTPGDFARGQCDTRTRSGPVVPPAVRLPALLAHSSSTVGTRLRTARR